MSTCWRVNVSGRLSASKNCRVHFGTCARTPCVGNSAVVLTHQNLGVCCKKILVGISAYSPLRGRQPGAPINALTTRRTSIRTPPPTTTRHGGDTTRHAQRGRRARRTAVPRVATTMRCKVHDGGGGEAAAVVDRSWWWQQPPCDNIAGALNRVTCRSGGRALARPPRPRTRRRSELRRR